MAVISSNGAYFGHVDQRSYLYAAAASLNRNETGQPQVSQTSTFYSASSPLRTFPPSSGAAPGLSYGLLHDPLISQSGMIVIIDYSPSEGEANIPITVNLELRSGKSDQEAMFCHSISLTSMRLRLVLGRTAVRTVVRRLPPSPRMEGEDDLGREDVMRLRLHAYAPPHSECRFPEQFSVPMTIQAMDAETEVVESFTFGTFTYWTPTTVRPAKTVDKQHPDIVLKLVRTTNAPAEALSGDAGSHTAELEWVVVSDRTPHPNTLCRKWSTHELAVGRRLIRFRREQFGNKLKVACEIIPQQAYNEDDIVISCVYRSETRNCWFTSVDIIYLLERLIGNPFSVEEKNRIRRNLEGFKPTTVSKNKAGYEAFFQRIMDFPPPKPRNIEKDVKVFPWSVLSQALDKIISKYSVIPREPSESPPTSSQGSSSPSSSEIPSSLPNVPKMEEFYQDPPTIQEQYDLMPGPPQLQILSPPTSPMEASSPTSPECMRTQNAPHRDEYYADMSMVHETYDVLPGVVQTQAFSNPFASNVSLAGLQLSSHAHGQSSAHMPLGNEAPASITPHIAELENSLQDAMYSHNRRTGFATELMYPSPDSVHTAHQGAMIYSYGQEQLSPETAGDLLCAQFFPADHPLFDDVVEHSG